MQQPRAPLRSPQLLAAAVIVECCTWLCSALGTGSTTGTAIPCTHLGTSAGERCQTGPARGAGTARALIPSGQLQMEAELPPFPGTPTGTAESSNPQGSPWAGREGTGHPRSLLPAGSAEQATMGSERPAPTQAPTVPTTQLSSGTHPVGNVTAEDAPTLQGNPSHFPSSTTVPGSAGGQWGPPSTLPGMGLVQRGSRSPSSPGPWAGEGPGVTILMGDSDPGTRPSVVPSMSSPVPGTSRMSPFGGGLQRLLTPTGTLRGTQRVLPGPAGGRSTESHLWHRMAMSQQGPHSTPHPSPPSLGVSGPGGLLSSTAHPDAETGSALLPAAGKDLGLLDPTTVAGTPGITSPSPGVAPDTATAMSGPPDTEDPPELSHGPLELTRHPPAMPGQPPASLTPGSRAVSQSRGPHTSPGSPRVPLALSSSSAAPMSPTLQPLLGTGRGVEGLSPAVSTPPAQGSPQHRLPHTNLREGPAESPQILRGTLVQVGDAEPWATTALLSWQPGSPDPTSAPGPPWEPSTSPPANSLGLDTTVSIATTITAATAVTGTTAVSTITSAAATVTAGTVVTVTTPTATTAPATTSPALLGAVGMVTPEPGATVLQRDVTGLTWGPPIPLPTTVLGPPQQPTSPSGTLAVPGSPGLGQLPSSPAGHLDPDTPRATAAAVGRAPQVFIVEDQPPLLKASVLRIPCLLVLDVVFTLALQDPLSHERRVLLHNFNRTVTPLFVSVPGFLQLEVKGIREGSVVLEYDALFTAERVQALGLGTLLDVVLGSISAHSGLVVGAAPVIHHTVLELPLDPCTELFACRAGFACVAGAAGNATCTSLCHRDYCKNQGICTHAQDHTPQCRCPVGSDFWFVGLRCDSRVTQQSLLGMAAGVLLSIVLLGAIAAAVAIRRFKALLLEARADQTRSSYRRFCRLDDVSAQYWSRSWLPSASSLDNPAFSNSEELLHLQILDNGCCGREDSGITDGSKHHPAPPTRRPSFHYDWDRSSSSMNDPMVDSGKASDISVSSWPMEPIQWTPFPLLHQLSRQRPHRARRPRSFCEGMELGSLERSWTA